MVSLFPQPGDGGVDVGARPVPACVRCRQPRAIKGRGLCNACYHWADSHGQLWRWPRRFRSRDEVVSDVQVLAPTGLTQREMAARMGMSLPALRRALCRARQGEPVAGTRDGPGRERAA